MEKRGVPRDTASEVERRQVDGLRAMSPSERLAQVAALCGAATDLAFAGIELREGQLSDAERRRRLATIRYGEALVRRVESYRAGLRDGS